MTFSIHSAAVAEYRADALWYDEKKPGLGIQFVSEVEAGIAAILENPERYGPIQQGIRRYA